MPRSAWVEGVESFKFHGDDTVVTLQTDEGPLILRGKRHTAVAAIAFCQQRYAELDAAERVAQILPIKKRARKH